MPELEKMGKRRTVGVPGPGVLAGGHSVWTEEGNGSEELNTIVQCNYEVFLLKSAVTAVTLCAILICQISKYSVFFSQL